MTDDTVLTEKDLADLETLAQDVTYHTLLQVWRDVLEPARKLAHEKVTPQWASNLLANYQGLTFADTENVRDLYFDKLEELRQLLLLEIATDKNSLTYDNAVDDLKENSQHYTNLIMTWQLAIATWEQEWEATAPLAAAELAAISMAHKMFFGEVGLMSHLEQIQYEFDEDKQRVLTEALDALREGR